MRTRSNTTKDTQKIRTHKKKNFDTTKNKRSKNMDSNNRGGRGYTRGGRGRGRAFGRGQGRFGGRYGGRTGSSPKSQEREMKFSPHQYQSRNTVTTYATTRDAIIQHIQKTYKAGQDVAKSLEDMRAVDLAAVQPTRNISGETDPTVKVVDQAGLDIKYQKELRRHLD